MEEFEVFLKECGHQCMSDTAPEDYNETCLKSVHRRLDEDYFLSMERFDVAKVLEDCSRSLVFM